MNKTLLKLENVTMQFGGVVAVNDLSLEVNEGEIVSLIGPNGAGKTTAFNVVTGVYEPTNGRVLFDGRVIVERQFRYPVNEVITEIPAGKRDSRDEAPDDAARRELREETGTSVDAYFREAYKG